MHQYFLSNLQCISAIEGKLLRLLNESYGIYTLYKQFFLNDLPKLSTILVALVLLNSKFFAIFESLKTTLHTGIKVAIARNGKFNSARREQSLISAWVTFLSNDDCRTWVIFLLPSTFFMLLKCFMDLPCDVRFDLCGQISILHTLQ